jgi:TatD DNase family protein
VLVDTHCHLDFNRFDQDRDEIVDRARQAGIKRILNPGITLESSEQAIRLAEKYPEVYAAVGVHPNDGSSWNGKSKSRLRELGSHKKVVAIGEIGLDFYRDRTPQDLQKRIFIEQLELAAELDLPVVIHTRDSIKDVLTILDEWSKSLTASQSRLNEHPGVLHSFSGDHNQANQARGLSFFVGITGPVTFSKASDLQNLVIRLPLRDILIETDAPFLTPHPYRGKRNEPARVKLVAEKIAELKQQAYNTVTEVTSKNAAQLFGW